MANRLSATELAEELKFVSRSEAFRSSAAPHAEALLENHLSERLAGRSAAERLALLDEVIRHLQLGDRELQPPSQLEEDVFSRLFALILGKELHEQDLPVAELYQRLADSLNTIFDSLNELIAVIHATLSDQGEETKTIRTVIGSRMEGAGNIESLESYLGQIKESFLTAHQAFKEAAQAKVGEILAELDPDHIASQSSGGGLGFGLFRKAELFENYQAEFKKCRDWFASGRFTEELLREFERRCQQLSK
jgi:hypothetical protein